MACICSPFTSFKKVPELKTLSESIIAACLPEGNFAASIQKRLISEFSKYKRNYVCNGKGKSEHELTKDCPTVHADMKSEANRLKSFEKGWPLSFIKPADCAAVGFFYLGDQDRVQCAFCCGIVASWEKGDEPVKEHAKHFPMCPFLLRRDVGNVPISGSNGSQSWQIKNSHAENVKHFKNSVSSNQPVSHNFKTKYPPMAHFDKRLQTYHNWPNSLSNSEITPVVLAESGFFYSGVADVVTCFCCGGSLGNWASGDSVWTEHAKHFPVCSFVNFIKGSAFIEQARMRHLSNSAATNGVQECKVSKVQPSNCSEEKSSDSARNCENANEKLKSITVTENKETHKEEHKFLCKICMEEGSRVAFLPCGHSLACPNCAKELQTCPLCRKQILSVVRLFFD